MQAKILMSKREAAEMLSVSVRTIDNLIRARELRPRRVGRRVLFPRTELERFSRGDHLTRPAPGDMQDGQR